MRVGNQLKTSYRAVPRLDLIKAFIHSMYLNTNVWTLLLFPLKGV